MEEIQTVLSDYVQRSGGAASSLAELQVQEGRRRSSDLVVFKLQQSCRSDTAPNCTCNDGLNRQPEHWGQQDQYEKGKGGQAWRGLDLR